ncbi:MAG TPA: hypothetical protein PK018_04220, partial [Candidatus Competibacter sp.]|nr:hypothetical protein [Candidatus Competibacter sp.]
MIDVVVHGDAESVCDSIHGIEDGIAEELFPQVVPDVFGWVEFRGEVDPLSRQFLVDFKVVSL